MAFAIALDDLQWELVADLFDPPGRRGAPAAIPRRAVVDATLFIAGTGCQWRRLPERDPVLDGRLGAMATLARLGRLTGCVSRGGDSAGLELHHIAGPHPLGDTSQPEDAVLIPGSSDSRGPRRSATQANRARTRTLHLPEGIRAVVFDLDGLLFDTENLWAEEESRMLVDYGVEYMADDRLATVGQTIDTSVAHYARRIGLPTSAIPALRKDLTERVRAATVERLQPLPGAIELVRAIARAGLPLGIASNNDRDMALLALEVAGLADAFNVVVSAEEVEHAKPAPDVYVRACAALGVAPSEALALEDSSSGLAAAHAAGMLVYAVPQFAETDVSAADRVLTSLEDLLR